MTRQTTSPNSRKKEGEKELVRKLYFIFGYYANGCDVVRWTRSLSQRKKKKKINKTASIE